ncbi:MAG TPA: M1 family metallopeptidase [Acidimicrobiia bacterium]|nr:M1 family metallopeptidase [Acidimicrobiia bacterium]
MRSPLLRLVPWLVLVVSACGDGASPITTTLAPPSTTATTSGGGTTVTTAPPTTTTTISVVGISGVGDPYYPDLGNPGYDVEHYSIEIEIDADLEAFVAATATIEAAATSALPEFHLDFLGLTVDGVTIDGAAAGFERVDGELVVTPQTPIPAGEDFVVAVTYHGAPQRVRVDSIGVDAGWTVVDGIAYVFAEPDGARTWFPGSDHPSDKATFTIVANVPRGLTAVANGELVSSASDADDSIFRWEMDQPMATYLAVLVVGDYELVDWESHGDIARRDFVPAGSSVPASFAEIPDMIDLFAEWFGPYPFTEYGHVVVPGFPAAMETQTMTLMGAGFDAEEVVAHELAHQWYGDSVTPSTWQGIWLNEGFATFGEFLWLEHRYGVDVMEAYAGSLHASLRFIASRPIVDPGVAELFGPAVYWRGGLTLLALRREVGDDAMKAILNAYHDRHRYGNAATADFIAVAEEVAGRDLDALFEAWLSGGELPPFPG